MGRNPGYITGLRRQAYFRYSTTSQANRNLKKSYAKTTTFNRYAYSQGPAAHFTYKDRVGQSKKIIILIIVIIRSVRRLVSIGRRK